MSHGGFFEFREQATRKPRAEIRPRELPATGSPGPPGASKQTSIDAITVSELTNRIDRAVRAGVPDTVYVRGEISNYRPNHSSGHVYFTLKDAATCIDCVMWKSDAARLKFVPTDGLELIATGKVAVFGKQGRYQLYVTTLRPLGKGSLELAFGQLRAKLEAEGLFAAERKKPLPRYPMTIVLVTGTSTAALQDILKVLRRYAWLRLMVYPVPVQGDAAAGRIAAAIAHVSRCAHEISADIILLARGGGSLEDLWAFNEEPVARAIAASRVAVITGIGHEVDVTIADLAADYHAHTPTEAAQIVSGHWRDVRDELDVTALRLGRGFSKRLTECRERLKNIERHEVFRRPMERINSLRQVLDDRQRTMTTAVVHRLHQTQWRVQEIHGRLDRQMPAAINRLGDRLATLQRNLLLALSRRVRQANDRVNRAASRLGDCHPKFGVRLQSQRLKASIDRFNRAAQSGFLERRRRLDALERQLQALNPSNVLQRGYSMTFRKKDGSLIRSVEQVKPGDRLQTRLADGQIESIADDPRQPRLFD
ncbi:MAG TPA: exodeoxyribonuclease VII large subunit [Tepidisphaeraceae bacterium]|jgi:exodeoxyribonuclease VII large subunit|nr:exodeoxyribonuclease VII large subunit [Tepidisphaeraceae bacterium]